MVRLLLNINEHFIQYKSQICNAKSRYLVFSVLAGSALPPELQCFISDSQLTRDAALHLGPEDCRVNESCRTPFVFTILPSLINMDYDLLPPVDYMGGDSVSYKEPEVWMNSSVCHPASRSDLQLLNLKIRGRR